MEKISLTNEQILKLKEFYEENNIVKFPEELDVLKSFSELKDWFGKSQYKYINFQNKKMNMDNYYDFVVFNTMITLLFLENNKTDISKLDLVENVLEKFNKTNKWFFSDLKIIFDRIIGEISFFRESNNIEEMVGYIIINMNYSFNFAIALIHNYIKNGNFETFFKKYKSIIQKHTTSLKSNSLVDDPSITTIDTTATVVVEPKYIPSSNGVMEQIKSKYGYYVPAAYNALQCNPVGLWYMHQQTGKYRSQFVDYSELDKSSDNMALNHIEAITKLMTKRTVYQMILQEMPEIGTDINGKTIKLKIAGYNASEIGLLALKDNEHVLAIIYDAAEDKAQGISGDKKNVDAWTAKKLAD